MYCLNMHAVQWVPAVTAIVTVWFIHSCGFCHLQAQQSHMVHSIAFITLLSSPACTICISSSTPIQQCWLCPADASNALVCPGLVVGCTLHFVRTYLIALFSGRSLHA